jgi:transposase
MARAYSVDLRRRVLRFIARGGSKAEAARVFAVHRATVYHWLSQVADRGDLKPKKAGRKVGGGKLAGVDFQSYLQRHANATLADMAAHFGVSGVAIWKRLHAQGLRYKKNISVRRT